jgi:hypothetical protein
MYLPQLLHTDLISGCRRAGRVDQLTSLLLSKRAGLLYSNLSYSEQLCRSGGVRLSANHQVLEKPAPDEGIFNLFHSFTYLLGSKSEKSLLEPVA